MFTSIVKFKRIRAIFVQITRTEFFVSWCYHWTLTVTYVVCSVSYIAAYKCVSLYLGTRSKQEWHRADEPAEIRKGRGYGQLNILEWSKRFTQPQTALLCRTHLRKCLLLTQNKTSKLVLEEALRRLLLQRTLTFGLPFLIVTLLWTSVCSLCEIREIMNIYFFCIPLSSVEGVFSADTSRTVEQIWFRVLVSFSSSLACNADCVQSLCQQMFELSEKATFEPAYCTKV